MTLSFAELALIVGMTTNLQADVDPGELVCMARNVYFEARGEAPKGQLAVAYLTLNRVDSPRFPDTVCDVVTEDRGPGAHDCQFSWYCDGRDNTPHDDEAYQRAILTSIAAMTGAKPNPVPGATHYYAPAKASPYWAEVLPEIASIGGHRFLKEM